MYNLKNATLLPLLQTVRRPPRLLTAVSVLQTCAVSTVTSHTTPERQRLLGRLFKQPGVTQRVAATVPRVEISRADPITHVQPMPGPSSRTVLGMHLVYSQPEMFKLKV